MSMTVAELIERLQDEDPDATVYLATQPSWPLQYALRGVATTTNDDDEREGPCPDHDREDCTECLAGEAGPAIVYLVEGGQPDHPYAPRDVFDAAY